jgi:CcmD family protein
MNGLRFLYAAYAATWIIHIGYLWTVSRRYKKLRARLEQLRKR